MKYRDPTVEEVRAARDAIAKECDYDLDKLFDWVRRRAAESRREAVRLAPRPPVCWRQEALQRQGKRMLATLRGTRFGRPLGSDAE